MASFQAPLKAPLARAILASCMGLSVVGPGGIAWAADALCDAAMSTSGGQWLFPARWGTWTDSTQEPPYHAECQGSVAGNAKAARITTANLNAVLLEWSRNTPYTALRRAEVTFLVPAVSLPNWNHLAVLSAYRRPLEGETAPVPPAPDERFGRIGADVFYDGPGAARLVIQFNKYADQGCDDTVNILYGWMVIPGGLQADHWYRLGSQIALRSDGGLTVVGTLRDFERPDLPIIAQTAYEAPAACTPAWYAGSENRWGTGVLGLAPGVDTYLDDFMGAPEQTAPVLSGQSVSNVTMSSAQVRWTTHEPATSQVEYGLTAAYGSTTPLDATLVTTHTVVLSSLQPGRLYYYRVKSKDAAGNLTTGPNATFSTLADTAAPTGTVLINGGAARTASRTVTLTLAATDNSGSVAQMQFSNGLTGYSALEPYATTKTWTLNSGTGTKTVRVKFKDASGNWSVPAVDTILRQ